MAGFSGLSHLLRTLFTGSSLPRLLIIPQNKITIGLALFVFLLCPSLFAQTTFTLNFEVFFTESATFAVAYNATTDHLLVAGSSVTIHNADTAELLGRLQDPYKPPGNLYFSLTVAEDGAIYSTLYPSGYFIRWENEAAIPTYDFPAERMPIVRNLRAYGSGIDTRIYCTGGDDNSYIQMATTTDSLSFTFHDLIDAPAAKSAVCAVAPEFNTVYGIQAWGSDYYPEHPDPAQRQGWPRRFDFVGGAWQVNTGFIPPDPEPDPENHFSYCIGGDYGDGLLWLFYYTNDSVWVLDASTGEKIAEFVSSNDYWIWGSVFVDAANDRVFWAAQGPPPYQPSGFIGSLTYEGELPPPVPPTPTPPPPPTPTPLVVYDFETGSQGWSFRTFTPTELHVSHWDHASSLVTSSAIGIASPYDETTNYFALWDSLDAELLPYYADSLYQADWLFSTNRATTNGVPSCRFRFGLTNQKAFSYERLFPGDWLPLAQTPDFTTYTLFFEPPIAADGLYLAFSLTDWTDDFRGSMPAGEIWLEEVSVYRHQLASFTNWQPELLEVNFDIWTTGSVPPYYPALWASSAEALSLSCGIDETLYFGCWNSPASLFTVEKSKLYRLTSHVSASPQLGGPDLRLGVHTDDYRSNWHSYYVSSYTPGESALPPTDGEDYHLYLTLPFVAQPCHLTFELIDLYSACGGTLTLHNLSLHSHLF